jgi:hypothetical protein
MAGFNINFLLEMVVAQSLNSVAGIATPRGPRHDLPNQDMHVPDRKKEVTPSVALRV